VSRKRSVPEGPSLSWLVRCWAEPREEPHGTPVLRIYVRDLKTGEERYLSDPRELGKLALRKMRDASALPAEKISTKS
jgi:hypothetical protein